MSRPIWRATRLTGWWSLAGAATLAAQSPPPTSVSSYAVPETPALTFLEAEPTEIARPTSIRALVTELANGIAGSGQVEQGFGLAIAPWSLIPSLRIPLSSYQNNAGSYLLANTQLSFGTVRSPGDSGATDMALGLRMTLWDNADPMRDTAFTAQLRRALVRCLQDVQEPPEDEEAMKRLQEECRKHTDAVKRVYRERIERRGAWNRSSFAVAAAYGLRLDESSFDQARELGWSVWAHAAFPLGAKTQLLGQLRYLERKEDPDGPERRAIVYGGRLFHGSASLNFFAEIAGEHLTDPDQGLARNATRWAVGLEFKAAEELWLSTGLGSDATTAQPDGRALVLAGLRWDVLPGPQRFSRW